MIINNDETLEHIYIGRRLKGDIAALNGKMDVLIKHITGLGNS